MAGGIDGKPASRAQRTSRRDDGLGLLGEREDLVVAQPEAHAGSVVACGLGLLAGRALARDQDAHAPRLVVAEARRMFVLVASAGAAGEQAEAASDDAPSVR